MFWQLSFGSEGTYSVPHSGFWDSAARSHGVNKTAMRLQSDQDFQATWSAASQLLPSNAAPASQLLSSTTSVASNCLLLPYLPLHWDMCPTLGRWVHTVHRGQENMLRHSIKTISTHGARMPRQWWQWGCDCSPKNPFWKPASLHQLALLCSFSNHDGLFLPITIVKVFQLGFSSSIENKALPGVPALPNLCLPVRLRVPVKIGEASISFGCGIGSQIWIQTYWRHILNQAWRLLSSKVLLRSRMGPCLCLIHVQGVVMLCLD